jgi:hypothetical protein
MMHRGKVRVAAITVLVVTALGVLTVPVMAEIARLTSLPLGKGSATVSWTGTTNGITPTIGAITGSARGLAIAASGVVPKQPQPDQPTGGSTSLSLPSSLPIADIKGTIAGAPFTLDIVLNLSHLSLTSKAVQTFGTVAGSFRGQPVHATLSGQASSSAAHFKGTIGADHVTGTISKLVHHGKKETAYATFDVTK